MNEVGVWIFTKKDGTILYELRGEKGQLVFAKATRKGLPPKDAIKNVCRHVEAAMKRACLPGIANPK